MRQKKKESIEKRLWAIYKADPGIAIRFCKNKGLKKLCQKMQQKL